MPCSLLSAEFGRAAARRRRETACHSEHFVGGVGDVWAWSNFLAAYLPPIGSDAAMCRVLDRGRTFYIAGRTGYADVLGRTRDARNTFLFLFCIFKCIMLPAEARAQGKPHGKPPPAPLAPSRPAAAAAAAVLINTTRNRRPLPDPKHTRATPHEARHVVSPFWAWLTITNPSPTLLLGSTGRLPLRRYHSLHTLHAHSRIRRFFRRPEARASCPSFALAAATASQVQAPLRESHR